jgi:hypothetical protein
MPTFNYSWGTYTLTPTALGNSISYNFNFASNPTTIAGIQGSALGGSMTFSGSGDSGAAATVSSPSTAPVPQTAPELPGFVAATWGFIIPVSAGERRIVCRVIWKGPDVMAANNFADVTVLLSAGYALDKDAIKHLDSLFGDGLLVHDAPTSFTADGVTIVFQQGDDDQLPDPDYVADVGAAYASGHRGQMLIKLQFNTEAFGGRIPSFTAVIRDEGAGTSYLPWGGAWSQVDKATAIILSDSDRTATSPGAAAWDAVRGTVSHSSGRRYFEFVINAHGSSNSLGISLFRWGFMGENGPALGDYNDHGLGTFTSGTMGHSIFDGSIMNAGLGAGSGFSPLFPLVAGQRYGVAVDIDVPGYWISDDGVDWWGPTGTGAGDPATGLHPNLAIGYHGFTDYFIGWNGYDAGDSITIFTEDGFLFDRPGDPTEFLYTYGISLVADYVGFSSTHFLFAGIPELAIGIIITTDINLLDFLKNSARLLGARFWESGSKVKFQRRVEGTSFTVDRTILTDDILFRNEKGSMPRTRENPRKIPSIVELTYFASTIQFTSSVIQARSEVVDSPTKMQLSVPWVDTPDQMLGFATRALYDGIAEAEGGTVGLPPAHLDIEPADIIELGITDDLADVVQVKAIKRLTNDAMEIEYTTFLQDVEIERVGYAGEMPEIIIAAGIIETSAAQTTQLPTQFALIQIGDIITAQALAQTTSLPSQTATVDILENLTAQASQTTTLPTQTATGQTSTFEGMIWNSADQSGMTVSNEDQTAVCNVGAQSCIRGTPFVSVSAGTGYVATFTRPNQGGNTGMGIATAAHILTTYLGKTTASVGWYATIGDVIVNDIVIDNVSTFTVSDVCIVAFKPVAGEWHVWFKVVGDDWNNDSGADPETDTGGIDTGITADVTIAVSANNATHGATLIECPAAELPVGYVDVYPGDPVAAAQTWSTTDKDADLTLTGSDRIATNTSAGYSGARMTQRIRSHDNAGAPLDKVCFAINPFGITGQWAVGIANKSATLTNYLGSDAFALGYFPSLAQFWRSASNVTTGTVPTATDSDTLLFEVDRTANVMRVKKLGGAWSTDQSISAISDDLYVIFSSSVATASAELIDYPETVTAGYTDLYDLLDNGPVGAWAWFKPETLGSGGSSVSSWTDSTGNGNDAVQATGANQCVVAANELNGFSAISAVDETDGLNLPSMAAFTAGSAFIVLKVSNYTNHGAPLQVSSNGGEAHYPWDSTQVFDNFGATNRPVWDPTPYDLVSYHILSLHAATNDKRTYINNVLAYSNTTNTVGFGSQPSIMGGNGVRTWGWIGKICEMSIFENTAMTDDERNTEYERLASKFDLLTYALMNDADKGSNIATPDGQTVNSTSGSWKSMRSDKPIPVGGKIHIEVEMVEITVLPYGFIGGLADLAANILNTYCGSVDDSVSHQVNGGWWGGQTGGGSISGGVAEGDIITFEIDEAARTIKVAKNNDAFASTATIDGTNLEDAAWYFVVSLEANPMTVRVNFGQDPWFRTPSTGYRGLY